MKGRSNYIRESFRLYLPPAVGYNFPLLLKLLRKYGVDRGYYGRALVIAVISMIGVPFRIYEKIAFDRKSARVKPEESPVFIIGHWRSGTTFLHNLLCEDPKAAYVTTYQSVFPDQTLTWGARFIFKNIMKMLIPINRKGDNVKLNADYPQEEEFALAARSPSSFYFFWYFPEEIERFFREFITFESSDHKLKETFVNDYKRVIRKALMHTGKTRFLSKNPVNTGRIPLLLEMYPDAKFIHIYRNPVDVILSTRHFFSKMMPGLTLHTIDFDKMNEDIFDIYDQLLQNYMDTKSMIPKRNLLEMRYEDLTSDTMNEVGRIYDQFGFGDFTHASSLIQSYADSKKGYVTNKYSIKRELLEEILQRTNPYMLEWGYQVPDNLEIID